MESHFRPVECREVISDWLIESHVTQVFRQFLSRLKDLQNLLKYHLNVAIN